MQAFDKNIKSLHVIRGLAALLVVVYHSKFVLWAGGTLWLKNIGFKHFYDYALFGLDMLSSCGAQCVLMFFLLSGFVIYHSFLRSDRDLRHFYTIRLVRIYLPYIFSLLASILVLAWIGNNASIAVDGVREYNSRLLVAHQEAGWLTTLKAIVFLPAREYAGFNFAYWSLLHEAIFYLAFPLYFHLGKRNRFFLFIVLLAIFLITKNNIFYFQLYFLLGMFLYDYYQSSPTPVFKNRYLYIPLMLICFCATNVLVKFFWVFADLAALATVLLAFDFLLGKNFTPKPFFKTLADTSFTLYLNHLWILMIWYAVCAQFLGKVVLYERYPYYLGVPIALLVSWLLYQLIEKKSLVMINRIKAGWKK